MTKQDDLFRAAVSLLTGQCFPACKYEHSVLGAQAFINDHYGDRESNYSAMDLSRFARQNIAEDLGYDSALVSPVWYHRMVCCLWIADNIADICADKVSVGNYWRPAPYNKAVGGSEKSTHIEGCAMDLDFSSRRDAEDACMYLESIYLAPWPLNLGLGLGKGGRRIHFDVFSSTSLDRLERGKSPTRWWRYKSDPEYPGPGR